MNNPAVILTCVGVVSGLLSGAGTGHGIAFIAPGLIFGVAVAFAAGHMLPFGLIRGLGIVGGSVVAFVAAEITSMFMGRFIPFSAPRLVGCLDFMAAGFVGGALLSLIAVPALRLVPSYKIGISIALAGGALGYIHAFVGIILADDARLPQPLPHMVGFMIWQTGVAAIIGAGLRNGQRIAEPLSSPRGQQAK